MEKLLHGFSYPFRMCNFSIRLQYNKCQTAVLIQKLSCVCMCLEPYKSTPYYTQYTTVIEEGTVYFTPCRGCMTSIVQRVNMCIHVMIMYSMCPSRISSPTILGYMTEGWHQQKWVVEDVNYHIYYCWWRRYKSHRLSGNWGLIRPSLYYIAPSLKWYQCYILYTINMLWN